MREILLATANPSKAREMEQILGGSHPDVRWRRLSEWPDWPEPVEDGETLRANAELKARYYAKRSGLWTIADDSGLEVDALGGEPGVRSARYAGEPKDDGRNNALLIDRLAGVPEAERSARFRCCVVLADGDQVLASAEGAVEGRIIDTPRGDNGFGYDPHFYVEARQATAAEMTAAKKNAISHRGQALRQLGERLNEILAAETI